MLRDKIQTLGISFAVHATIAGLLAALAAVKLVALPDETEPIELVVIDVADLEPEPELEPEPDEIEPDPEVPTEPRPARVPEKVEVARVDQPKPFQPDAVEPGDRPAPDAEAVPAPTAPLLSMESTVGGGAELDYVSTAQPGGPEVARPGSGVGAPGPLANQGAAGVEVAADWQITTLPRPLNDRSFEPRYPPLARREGREAKVVLELHVDPGGRVVRASVLRGPEGHGFRESALEYGRKLRFSPARAKQNPVASVIEWTVYFYARN